MPDRKKSVLKKGVKQRDQMLNVRMKNKKKNPMKRRTYTRKQRRNSSALLKLRRRSNQHQARTLPKLKNLGITRLLKRLPESRKRKLPRKTETLSDPLKLKMGLKNNY